jgi:hypothetical protein
LVSPGERPDLQLEEGLQLRLIRPDDEPRLIALHQRLSQHTRILERKLDAGVVELLFERQG